MVNDPGISRRHVRGFSHQTAFAAYLDLDLSMKEKIHLFDDGRLESSCAQGLQAIPWKVWKTGRKNLRFEE